MSAPSVHRKRKFHHKVRTGCSNCRQRRTKCDETKPACRRCTVAGLTCKGYNEPKAWIFEVFDGSSKSQTAATNSDSNETSPSTSDPEVALQPSDINTVSRRQHEVHLTPKTMMGYGSFTSPTLRNSYSVREKLYTSQLFEFVMHVYGPNFIWRLHTNAQEQRLFAPKFVHFLLSEASLLEAIFSIATLQMPLSTTADDEVANKSFHHYSRACTLLQKRLNEPTVAQDDSLFWTVISLMLLNQDRGDWKSFAVHLDGLRRIVQLRGDRDANWGQCSRVMRFAGWAEACYRRQLESQLDISPKESRRRNGHNGPSKQKCAPATCPSFSTLPAGIRKMVLQLLLRREVVVLANRTVEWFMIHNVTVAEELVAPDATSSRTDLGDDLDNLLKDDTLDWPEFLLCLGMFILVISHPPLLIERYPMPLNQYIKKASAVPSEIAGTPWGLWAALMNASIPVCFGTPPVERWCLLEHYIECEGMNPRWTDAKSSCADFFTPKHLQSQWAECWNIAVKRLGL